MKYSRKGHKEGTFHGLPAKSDNTYLLSRKGRRQFWQDTLVLIAPGSNPVALNFCVVESSLQGFGRRMFIKKKGGEDRKNKNRKEKSGSSGLGLVVLCDSREERVFTSEVTCVVNTWTT